VTLFPEAGFDAIAAPPAGQPGSFHFRLSEDSRCFDGHFDGEPILPGVVHLALALTACAKRHEAGSARVLTGVKDLRFRRKLHPGDEVEIVLIDGREPLSVRFEIRCGGELATAGLLLFMPRDDPRHD
jgi:3-hydroxymyristoyl/3-hydroxydecanoyl-(acyl carrier protein) dehydratase